MPTSHTILRANRNNASCQEPHTTDTSPLGAEAKLFTEGRDNHAEDPRSRQVGSHSRIGVLWRGGDLAYRYVPYEQATCFASLGPKSEQCCTESSGKILRWQLRIEDIVIDIRHGVDWITRGQ